MCRTWDWFANVTRSGSLTRTVNARPHPLATMPSPARRLLVPLRIQYAKRNAPSPDPKGNAMAKKLAAEDYEQHVMQWVESKCKHLKCLACDSDEMAMCSDEPFLALCPIKKGVGVLANAGVPVVSVFCPQCGFIRLFHAGTMGLSPDMM